MRNSERFLKERYNGLDSLSPICNLVLYRKFQRQKRYLKMQEKRDILNANNKVSRALPNVSCPICSDEILYCRCYENLAIKILETYGKDLLLLKKSKIF